MPTVLKVKLKQLKARQLQNKLIQPNDYNTSENYVCVDIKGNLFKTDYVTRHFQLILKRNGLESIRFHDLRHSSATYLRSLGFSMKEIQDWLGHADIMTTMNTYTHLDIEDKKVIADKLNEKLISFGV